jgi:beta-lactamase class A
MKTLILTLLVLPIISSVGAQGLKEGPNAEIDAARANIEQMIAASGAEVVAVSFHDLETGRSLQLNERRSLHAASTMKLPVMMEVFRLAEEKQIDLSRELGVKNVFYSIVDGSEYRLDKKDDSDQEIYGLIGQKMSVRSLVDRMITTSSNLATNLLIQLVTPPKIMSLLKEAGANDMRVLRGVEDSKAFAAGKNNITTAYDLHLLFRAIAENRILSRASCDEMVAILASQKFNEGIPAGLPAGIRVAHKTGEITAHNHDAAIVFLPGRKPYVLVVLTKGISDQRQSSELIAGISSVIYRLVAK